MSSSIYRKLALTNLKNNRKAYVPYILTCLITIAMFYIMAAVAHNPGLNDVSGSDSLRMMLFLGVQVIGIFAVIFLFYTNSFLMKQRKKEIGLYNVLGLGKRHIAKMLTCEMLVVAAVSLFGGLGLGIVLSKLMFLIFQKLLHFDFSLEFIIEGSSILASVILFCGIFVVSLIYNLLQIRLTNPIELLYGGNHGEKEPRTKWIMTIIGILTIGGGYYIAQTTDSPLAALNMFFVAVVLVIIGTYALFTAGSIALLKLLKKNKKFYYHTRHFISVSGMIYRMKQNAVGLANICVLSSMVLVTVSTTVAMYVGMDDLLKTRYSHECIITGYDTTPEEQQDIREIMDRVVSKYQLTMDYESEIECSPFMGGREEEAFYLSEDSKANTAVAEGVFVYMMTVDAYNQLEKKMVSLMDDEVMLYALKRPFEGEELTVNDKNYQVTVLDDMNVDKKSYMTFDIYYMVVPNQSIIDGLMQGYEHKPSTLFVREMDWKESTKKQIPALEEMKRELEESGIALDIECRELERESFYSLYGVVLFLGMFLGSLFLMATVLIIYYKQISEGYDDKERFAIMQKVGMSQREVKQSIRSQVMTVFFMPLAMAILHIIVAFKVITKLLAVLNLTNVPLFFTCTVITVAVFALFYVFVYVITAREYYKIVK